MDNLFTLTEQQNHVLQMVENEELTQEQAQDTLDALNMEIKDKIEAYCHVNRRLSAEFEALKSEEARVKKLKSEKESQIKRLKSYLLAAMKNAELTKFDTGLFKVSTRKGVESVVVNVEPDELPKEYIKTTESPDKTAIKNALKAGDKIPGAELVTGESSLIIK